MYVKGRVGFEASMPSVVEGLEADVFVHRFHRLRVHDLRALGLESLTLSDPPADLEPDTRRWAVEFAARQVRSIREQIFPIHGL